MGSNPILTTINNNNTTLINNIKTFIMDDLKTYLFRYTTNYNLGIVIVNANSEKEAKIMALKAGAWDTDDITVISNEKHGVVLSNGDSGSF